VLHSACYKLYLFIYLLAVLSVKCVKVVAPLKALLAFLVRIKYPSLAYS